MSPFKNQCRGGLICKTRINVGKAAISTENPFIFTDILRIICPLRFQIIDIFSVAEYILGMLEQFSRTQLLLGEEAMQKLASSRVAVFGIGGVGGYAVEALARSGIGALDLVDNDKVCVSNVNRQIHATLSSVGRYKTEVAAERIADINPSCKVHTHNMFFLPESQSGLNFALYDYVIDAIDTVSGKLAIIKSAKAANVPVISSMGAGNKLNPAAFEVSDIYKTSVCPLAKTMRRELRKMGIDNLKVVYSREEPKANGGGEEIKNGARRACGSVAFVPSVAGLIMAGEVIKDLITAKK